MIANFVRPLGLRTGTTRTMSVGLLIVKLVRHRWWFGNLTVLDQATRIFNGCSRVLRRQAPKDSERARVRSTAQCGKYLNIFMPIGVTPTGFPDVGVKVQANIQALAVNGSY